MSLALLAKNIAKLSTGTGSSAKNILDNTNKVKDLEIGLSISEISELLSEAGLSFFFDIARAELSTTVTIGDSITNDAATYGWALTDGVLDKLAVAYLGTGKTNADLKLKTWKEFYKLSQTNYVATKSRGFGDATVKTGVVGPDHEHLGMVTHEDDNIAIFMEHIINQNAQYFSNFIQTVMFPLIAVSLKVAYDASGKWPADQTQAPAGLVFQKAISLAFIIAVADFNDQYATMKASIDAGNATNLNLTVPGGAAVQFPIADALGLYMVEYIILSLSKEGIWLSNPDIVDYSAGLAPVGSVASGLSGVIGTGGPFAAFADETYVPLITQLLFGVGFTGNAKYGFAPKVSKYGDFVEPINKDYNNTLISTRTTKGTSVTVSLVYKDAAGAIITANSVDKVIRFLDIDIKNTELDSIVKLELASFGDESGAVIPADLAPLVANIPKQYITYDSTKHLSSYTISLADVKTNTKRTDAVFSTYNSIMFP